MPDSVGSISLDLIIKDTIEKQLNNIKMKISSSLSNTAAVQITPQLDTSGINKEINNLSVMVHHLGDNISTMTSRLNANVAASVVLDVVTGLVKAKATEEGLSSAKGWKGFWKN